MKKNEIRQITCNDYEILIAKKFSGMLEAGENILISQHLQECKACARNLTALQSLHQHMRSSSATALAPEPATRKILRERMLNSRIRKQASVERRGWVKLLKTVICLLKFRVPVYQVVLGGVVLMALLVFANYISYPGNRVAARMNEMVQLADSTGLHDTLQTAYPEKPGRTLREDSLMARFITTIM